MGCFPSKSRIRSLITRAGKTEDERGRSQYTFDSEDADLSDNDHLSTKPKSSVTITVRPTGPSVAQKCLDEILPAADDQTAKRGKPIGPVGWGIWKTKKERQTFIRAVLIVLSGNGYRSISESRIELFFPRCGMDVMAYRAGLAVMEGSSNDDYMSEVATHSFVARQFGVDRKSAFKELMFDIEAMLESHLHNGNTHISRYGIGGGQKELESQMRNRAIKSIDENISPAEAAHAMNGDDESYRRPLSSMTSRTTTTVPAHMAKRNSSYGGFVVGEVESQHCATASSLHPTTGGVGAEPYGNWMHSNGTTAPLQTRARQMWPRVMPIERPQIPTRSPTDSISTLSLGAQSYPSYTSYGTGHIGSRGYYGAQPHDRYGLGGFVPGMGFMPVSQRSMMAPAPPSSSISDPTAYPPSSALSDTRQDSTSTSSGPSTSRKLHGARAKSPAKKHGTRTGSPMPDMPGAAALNKALEELADITSITPPETVAPHTSTIAPSDSASQIVAPAFASDVPIIKEPMPPLRRRTLVESACNSNADCGSSIQSSELLYTRLNTYQFNRRNSNRSMKGRPSTKMHYYGMNRVDEDKAGEDGELFA